MATYLGEDMNDAERLQWLDDHGTYTVSSNNYVIHGEHRTSYNAKFVTELDVGNGPERLTLTLGGSDEPFSLLRTMLKVYDQEVNDRDHTDRSRTLMPSRMGGMTIATGEWESIDVV